MLLRVGLWRAGQRYATLSTVPNLSSVGLATHVVHYGITYATALGTCCLVFASASTCHAKCQMTDGARQLSRRHVLADDYLPWGAHVHQLLAALEASMLSSWPAVPSEQVPPPTHGCLLRAPLHQPRHRARLCLGLLADSDLSSSEMEYRNSLAAAFGTCRAQFLSADTGLAECQMTDRARQLSTGHVSYDNLSWLSPDIYQLLTALEAHVFFLFTHGCFLRAQLYRPRQRARFCLGQQPYYTDSVLLRRMTCRMATISVLLTRIMPRNWKRSRQSPEERRASAQAAARARWDRCHVPGPTPPAASSPMPHQPNIAAVGVSYCGAAAGTRGAGGERARVRSVPLDPRSRTSRRRAMSRYRRSEHQAVRPVTLGRASPR
jgi:hypothetical protein